MPQKMAELQAPAQELLMRKEPCYPANSSMMLMRNLISELGSYPEQIGWGFFWAHWRPVPPVEALPPCGKSSCSTQ